MAKRSSRRSKAKSRRNKNKQGQGISVSRMNVIAVVVLIAFGAGLVLATTSGSAPPVADERLELDPMLGDAAAPVTIVEYGAYGCTACRAFHQSGAVERLLNAYPGQVNFVFRDFPVIVPEYDRRAAQIAQCALDQSEDGFWELHDAFYSYARIGDSAEELIDWGDAVGLDSAELNACYEAGTHRRTVSYDLDRGRDLGLPSTPAFLVNGQRVFSPTEQALRAAIEAALAS